MKRFVSMFCAAALALTVLAGCSNAASSESTASSGSAAASSESSATSEETASSEEASGDSAAAALVFAAQVQDGTADPVVEELTAYKDSLSSHQLYAEYADKIAQSEEARIVSSGNFVVMVIAGVGGPDYAEIDTAIESALA